MKSRPLIERREQPAKLLKKLPENIKFSEELRGTKEELLQVALQFQLEALVAKKRDSLYESGRRSGAWVKVKLTQEQEFVVGGYTPPGGSRKYFGALLVGYQRGCFSPAASALASPKRPWRPCMRACRRSNAKPAPS